MITRSCFIIGPMRDMALGENARLKKLAKHVIKPLLEVYENRDNIRYKVQTPYDLGGGHIMNDVIYAIDRADLVIADLTDSNPNVFYELGICHSLGRACVQVLEERSTKVEFDIAAYRVYKIDLDNDKYAEAQISLREVIDTAHRSLADWSRFENPVIDFFRAPITYISPAFSLAQGYYLNFVKPVVESMIKRKGTQHLYDIGTSPELTPKTASLEAMNLLGEEDRKTLKLHIVIPGRVDLAKRNFADKFRGRIPAAVVEGDGRSYTCFYRGVDQQTTPTLIDIPTTLRVMEDAIDRRMRHRNIPHDAREWREVEDQEIERFRLNLQMFIQNHEMNPEFSRRIEISTYDPERPAELGWLYQIL